MCGNSPPDINDHSEIDPDSELLEFYSDALVLVLHFSEVAGSVKISNLFICFCSFHSSCPILELFIFYQTFIYCIALSY